MADRIARALTALGLALALAACVSSSNPAGPEGAAVAEKGLIGHWRYAGTQDDVWTFVHVMELENNGLQVVAINELRSDWIVLAGHVTVAGPRRVLSLRLVAGSDGVRGQIEKQGRPDLPYSFVAYRLEGKDRLVVAQPFKPLQVALQEGKLSGEVSPAGVFVTDEPARIAAVFAGASDPELFARSTVYLRIPEP
jgi:hypothetical protein